MNEGLNTYRHVIALVLLILPFIDWSAVWIIRRAVKAIKAQGKEVSIALRERYTVAKILAIIVSLNGIIGFAVFFNITLPPSVGLAILTLSLVLVTTPNLYWLYLYSWNKFKD